MKLIQKGFFKGSQIFEVGDNEILVQLKHYQQNREFKIPLNIIGKNSEICRGKDYWLLITSILFILLTALCVVLLFVFDEGGFTGFSIIAFLVSAYTYHCHKKRSYDYLIYYNIFSGQPALVFWNDKPDKETFSGFIGQLNDRLSKQEIGYISQDSGMANEIHKLYGLWQKGILSEEEFKAGKTKLLGAEGEDWKL
jgi:hypothetical protein